MRISEMTDEQLARQVDDDALARELYSRLVLARHRVSEQVQALEHQRDKAQADYEKAMHRVGQLEHQINRYEKELDYAPWVAGEQCPEGKVQVEFVGTSDAKAHSKYGWNPGSSAFFEIYVDGQRYHIDVGTADKGKGPVRGLHIIGPIDMAVDKHSLNACSISARPRS